MEEKLLIRLFRMRSIADCLNDRIHRKERDKRLCALSLYENGRLTLYELNLVFK